MNNSELFESLRAVKNKYIESQIERKRNPGAMDKAIEAYGGIDKLIENTLGKYKNKVVKND